MIDSPLQLAVDLAVKFNGEIINADAMQMYRGLPIITNQITDEERRGIPHHLLATVDIDEPTWTNGVFAREATKHIREIRSRGRLPIVVGGSQYYISSLLFPGSLIDSPDDAEAPLHASQLEIEQQYPILTAPTDLMLKRLREVDPVMADRWHPDDRRKIKRSLAIFLTTGRKASDIYAEQENAKAAADRVEHPWDTLLFWVYSDPEILKDRLDKRVDKMERSGLIHEVRELHKHLMEKAAAGEAVDRTRGIWQSIGFKQYEPFLIAENDGADPADLAKLRLESMDLTKIATRQYARYQLKWLRTKTFPELKENNALDLLYLVDSSEASKFADKVLSPAANITQAYLHGVDLPEPASISTTAQSVLSAFTPDALTVKPKYQPRSCDVCHMTLQTEDQWTKHIGGRRHRRALRQKSRTALIVLDRPVDIQGTNANGTDIP